MMVLYIAVLGVFLIYVICNEMTYSGSVGRETAFLADFDEFLSHVRHFYYYTNSAEDAIFYSIPKCSKRIRPILEELFGCLESEDRVRMLSDIAGGRHKYVRLFTSLVMTVSENGDLFEGSSSVFLDSVMQLRCDVQSEKRYLEGRKHRFTGLGLTAALPSVAVPAVAAWGSDTIPSLKSFYYGRGGGVMLCLILMMTVLCYTAITYLREGHKPKEAPFAAIAAKIAAGKGIVSKAAAQLKKLADRLGADVLLKRTVLASAAVIIMVPVLAAGHAGMRRLLANDVSDVENVSDTADGNQLKAMKTAIPKYMHEYLGEELPEEDELAETLLDEPGFRSRSVAADTAAEIIRRLKAYRLEFFGLSDLLIVLAAAGLAFVFPDVKRIFKNALLDGQKQDEVMRFQSLINMQKRVPGITPVEILESMEAFSDIFRNSLQQCINNYGVNDELALTELFEAEDYPEFRKLTDCFLAVDEAGVENAFEEVTAQITSFRESRELDRTILMDNNVMLASLLAVIPGGLVLFGYLLIPFMARAMTMFNDYQDALRGYMN
ncbi:MAG: hypothetical protein J6U61_10640 [Lachnospiraceae bacterium]|nr:hypothetical protein [Lachnospiraceae bacterium]